MVQVTVLPFCYLLIFKGEGGGGGVRITRRNMG